MPMSGGTRMLRARRKDCNVKPNRRLDRKSSRGMLFENEELRMRTITINAEVEQGQHALKKLRRENEQLRREMWCLRDEYDKMEKLLRKREEGEESDQENSDSDDNCSRAEESNEDKRALRQQSIPDFETKENLSEPSHFGNEANVRTFAGLSVIDEQTEETQTTESAAGYGTLSRGNSANRTFCQDEACRIPELPPFDYGQGFAGDWAVSQCDTYDARPASPYPYTGSLRPSYQKQFQVLQDLPLLPQTPATAIGENGWIFTDPSKLHEIPKYNVYVDDPVTFEGNLQSEKPSDPGFRPTGFGFELIQDRGGPDVFVTGGYSQVNNEILRPDCLGKVADGDVEGERENIMNNVEAEIDKIEISEKSEIDPKMREMTVLTKPGVSRSGAGSTTIPREPQETLDPGKLTMDEAVDKNDNGISKHVQQLVTCQKSNGQDVRETIDTAEEAGSNDLLTDDMPQMEKPGSSKYQTRLMVTLKTPGVRPEGRAPKKVPGPVPPRGFQPQGPRYGMKPEYGVGQRFQTFPSPGFQANARMPPANGREWLANRYAGVRMPGAGTFGSMPRLATFVPKNGEPGLTPSNIPDELDKEIDVLPVEESLAGSATQSLVKPVKIPPVPPPRTSSCPKPIIPAPPVGVSTFNQRTFTKGKPLQPHDSFCPPQEPLIYNPLLMSQPMATSSPTISLKGTKYFEASSENVCASKYLKPSYNEDSSLEEFSRHKLRLKEELPPRADVPKLNKSLSSPSFGSFRTLRRKQSEALATSVENIFSQKIPEAVSLAENLGKGQASQNNASVSSSSGLDSPTKSERRKRRVSIQFKKKQAHGEGKRPEEEGVGKDSTESRRDSVAMQASHKGHRGKARGEETDATTSERERTNSVSSRTSSVTPGRKYSISSNRTYLNEEKIPWCGCWGNGCV